MYPRLERTLDLGRAVVHEVRAEQLPFMAASIAYHAFVSLLPLFLLVLAVLAAVGTPDLERGVLDLAGLLLTRGASDVLVGELRTATRSTGVSVFGAVVLLWGTLRVFRGLDTAFSDIYETAADNTFLDQVLDGVLVLVVVAAAILVGAAVQRVLPAGAGPLPWLVRHIALVLGLALALAPMYYVFPDADVTLPEIVPGVLVTAVGLAVFQGLFRLYLAVSARQPEQSVVAGILVFLTWLYCSGFVLLLGAAVNAVLSNRSADISVDPVLAGVPRTTRVTTDRATLTEAVERLDRLLVAATHADGPGDRDDTRPAAIDGEKESPDPGAADGTRGGASSGLVVAVDGELVVLPLPDDVVTTADDRRLLPGGEVGIELSWSPRE